MTDHPSDDALRDLVRRAYRAVAHPSLDAAEWLDELRARAVQRRQEFSAAHRAPAESGTRRAEETADEEAAPRPVSGQQLPHPGPSTRVAQPTRSAPGSDAGPRAGRTELDPPVLTKLRSLGPSLPFFRGTTLAAEGDDSDEVLLIEAGSVKVVWTGHRGNDAILGFYGPGSLLGEMGVLFGGRRSASIVARTDGRAVHVDGARFLALADEDPELLRCVADMLRQRLRLADQRREYRAMLDVPARLARQLLDLARECGERTERGFVLAGMTPAEMAQWVTASPKSVESALDVLRDDGMLVTDRRHVEIVDASRLEQWVEDSYRSGPR